MGYPIPRHWLQHFPIDGIISAVAKRIAGEGTSVPLRDTGVGDKEQVSDDFGTSTAT